MVKQNKLIEYFVAGVTARCAAGWWMLIVKQDLIALALAWQLVEK